MTLFSGLGKMKRAVGKTLRDAERCGVANGDARRAIADARAKEWRTEWSLDEGAKWILQGS